VHPPIQKTKITPQLKRLLLISSYQIKFFNETNMRKIIKMTKQKVKKTLKIL